MSLVVDIPPSLESEIRARAAAAGKDADCFAVDLLREQLDAYATPVPELDPVDDPNVPVEALTPAQQDVRFERMLEVLRRNAPDLPPGYVVDDSREFIYGEREDAQL